ncbi:MAG: monomethylamine:corrinoid methyltransferase [Butyricicoccus pullicaecorum]|jgi:methylamine--corrinoid protein Co-methyltransferase|nr:monomethylamine:corrinoid methyltransferase [Butyricicoccus pullicaecorum]
MNQKAKIFDVVRRSIEGPIVSEQDFDMKHIYQNLKKIVKKYDIKIESESIINFNDELADRVWNAAIEFLSKSGVYCKDTGRIVQYTEDEIRQSIRMAPDHAVFGEGNDTVHEYARTADDPRPPVNLGGSVNVPCPNEYFVPIMLSYMQEPRVDFHCPTTNLTTINGIELRTRTPLEIFAAYEEVQLFRHVAAMSGRAGMPYNGVGISVSDVGELSASHLMKKTDSHSIGVISELKFDNAIMNKITQCVMLDHQVMPYANPIYGGLGGGLNTQVVLLTAEMIALSIIFMGTTVGTTPTHPNLFCSTTKELLQMTSVAFQAISRNSHIMTRLTHTMVGGLATKTFLYEIIASCLVATKSGLARLQGPRAATGAITGACSGLEARFQGEVLHAAVKISREKAEEIVQKAYALYKDDLDKKPYGKPFWEVYDVKTIQPKQEWLDVYNAVRAEAISWGLPLDEV